MERCLGWAKEAPPHQLPPSLASPSEPPPWESRWHPSRPAILSPMGSDSSDPPRKLFAPPLTAILWSPEDFS